jgi:hypothetical protein
MHIPVPSREGGSTNNPDALRASVPSWSKIEAEGKLETGFWKIRSPHTPSWGRIKKYTEIIGKGRRRGRGDEETENGGMEKGQDRRQGV